MENVTFLSYVGTSPLFKWPSHWPKDPGPQTAGMEVVSVKRFNPEQANVALSFRLLQSISLTTFNLIHCQMQGCLRWCLKVGVASNFNWTTCSHASLVSRWMRFKLARSYLFFELSYMRSNLFYRFRKSTASSLSSSNRAQQIPQTLRIP